MFQQGISKVVVTADDQRLPDTVETELVVGHARIYLTDVDVLEAHEMSAFRAASKRQRAAFNQD